MKRFMLMQLLLLLSLSMFAIGRNDGSNMQNAIDFDWQTQQISATGNREVFYCISLDPIYTMDVPMLSLVLANNTDVQSSVVLTAYLLGEVKNNSYTIPAHDKKVWTKDIPVKMLEKMNADTMYLSIKCSQPMSMDADILEQEDIVSLCERSKPFVSSGMTIAANSEDWYEVDLRTVKLPSHSGKILVLEYKNEGSSPVTMTASRSPECPTTSVTELNTILAAGQLVKDTISRAILDALTTDLMYLQVRANGAVRVRVLEENKPGTESVTGSCKATTIVPSDDDWISIRPTTQSGRGFYKVARVDLIKQRHQPQIVFDNRANSVAATATVDVFFECGMGTGIDYTRHVLNVGAGEMGTMDFAMNMVQSLRPDIDTVYAHVKVSQPMQVQLRMRHIREKDACRYAADFDWVRGHSQHETGVRWYAVDLTDARLNPSDIELTVVNRSGSPVTATAEVAFACPYVDVQSTTRRIGAGDTARHTISYGLFSAMSDPVVYVGVKADGPIWFGGKAVPTVVKEPDPTCLSAMNFDWQNGVIVPAGADRWYRVSLDELRNTELLPSVTIVNRGASSLHINAEMSIECPDSLPNQTRSFTLAPGKILNRAISRDMVNNLDPSIEEVYVHVTGDQEFSIRVEMSQKDAGENCATAIDFNWVSGHDQVADTVIWYAIDLTEAKAAQGYDLSLTLINRSSVAGKVTGEMALSCPYENTTKQSLTLAANAFRTKVIPHQQLMTFDDFIWVRVESNVALHFEAEMIPAAPFTPIYVCSSATPVAFNRLYSQTVDTAWYVVDLSGVTGTDLVPHVVLTNGAAKQTIRAEISYACPVVETMISYTVTLDAGRQVEKILERAMAESIASKYDRAWIRLTGKSAFDFKVDMINPNTGSDCMHARELLPDETVIQAAGTTAWYRVRMDALREPNTKTYAWIGNRDGMSGRVEASLYSECGGEVIQTGSIGLAANGLFDRALTSKTASAFSSEYLYIELYTQREDSIRFTIEPATPIDTIWACQDARELVPNTSYTLAKNAETWYMLDLATIRENYTGNGTFEFVNYSQSDTVEMLAAMEWECPVTYEMEYRTIRIKPGEDYVETLLRSTLEDLTYDTVYLCLISSADVVFRAEFKLERGMECDAALDFDWESKNPYYADKNMWYAVHIDGEALGDHDLCLHADNLGSDAANTRMAVYSNCESATPKLEMTNMVAAGQTSNRVICQDTLAKLGWWPDTTIYVLFQSHQNMRLWIDTIPACRVEEFDTICAGDSLLWHGMMLKQTGVYRDTVDAAYGSKRVYTMKLEVLPNFFITYDGDEYSFCDGDSLIVNGIVFKESAEWTDTVPAANGCHTYLHYVITKKPVYKRVVERQSICDGVPYQWHGRYYSETGTYCDTLQSSLGCDSIVYLVLKNGWSRYDSVHATICEGDTLEVLGTKMYRDGEYPLVHPGTDCPWITRYFVKVQTQLRDTVKHDFYDSICIDGVWYKSNFERVEYQPLDMVCEGSERVHMYIYHATNFYTDTIIDGCEGSAVIYAHPLTGVDRYFYTDTIVRDTLRAGTDQGGLIVRIAKIVFHTTYTVYEKNEITMREGQILSWKSIHLDKLRAPNRNEVFHVDTCYTFTPKPYLCDSVVCVHINVLPRTDTTLFVSICDGKSYTVPPYQYAGRWYTKSFSKAGIYSYTQDNHLGGDSVVTILLTVNPSYDLEVPYTLMVGDSMKVFNPETGRDTTLYAVHSGDNPTKFHSLTQDGCDSLLTIHIYGYDPMAVEDVWGDGEHVTKKLLYHDQLYMIVDDRRYDIMGRRVK